LALPLSLSPIVHPTFSSLQSLWLPLLLVIEDAIMSPTFFHFKKQVFSSTFMHYIHLQNSKPTLITIKMLLINKEKSSFQSFQCKSSPIINLRQFDEEHNNFEQTTSVMSTLAPTPSFVVPTTNTTSGVPKNQFHSLHHFNFFYKKSHKQHSLRISNARKQFKK
jgi:hypothetical protein